ERAGRIAKYILIGLGLSRNRMPRWHGPCVPPLKPLSIYRVPSSQSRGGREIRPIEFRCGQARRTRAEARRIAGPVHFDGGRRAPGSDKIALVGPRGGDM